MEITNLEKDEILKLTNKAGAYEFGRQNGYRFGFENGARSVHGDVKMKELQHEFDSTRGLWCIDRDPATVDLDWIKENCFQL